MMYSFAMNNKKVCLLCPLLLICVFVTATTCSSLASPDGADAVVHSEEKEEDYSQYYPQVGEEEDSTVHHVVVSNVDADVGEGEAKGHRLVKRTSDDRDLQDLNLCDSLCDPKDMAKWYACRKNGCFFEVAPYTWSPIPRANGDSYKAKDHVTPLHVASPTKGILMNDECKGYTYRRVDTVYTEKTDSILVIQRQSGPDREEVYTDKTNGQVSVNADGSFTYTPPGPSFCGWDAFQYDFYFEDGMDEGGAGNAIRAIPQGVSNNATVQIAVPPVRKKGPNIVCKGRMQLEAEKFVPLIVEHLSDKCSKTKDSKYYLIDNVDQSHEFFLHPGSYRVTATATNKLGFTSLCSTIVDVVDKPTISTDGSSSSSMCKNLGDVGCNKFDAKCCEPLVCKRWIRHKVEGKWKRIHKCFNW